MEDKNKIVEQIIEWRYSPIFFVRDMWNLVPQPIVCEEVDCDHLKKECYAEFERGKHLSWQQFLVLRAVERSVKGQAPTRVSVASGHGTGKSATCAWLIFWFLLTRKQSQIGCTAPSSPQIFDVLWKEAEIWRRRMPNKFAALFEWQSSYIRVVESPETHFARARTGRKERPEAFAGLHSRHVMLIADEASGVDDEIYRTAEGSLTEKDTLVILISNPTRLEGYFYSTHNDKNEKRFWQTLQFSSIDSPLVESDYVGRIMSKYGEDSNEYKFMVLGQFPSSEGMIDGWLPMFSEEDISNQVPDIGPFMNPVYMGLDPSGQGKNKSVWVARDAFKMKVLATESKSETKKLAEKTITLAQHYEIKPGNVNIDAFGVGMSIGQEIALGVQERVNSVNIGDKPSDERFLNLRAESYWAFRDWLKRGGKLVKHEGWRELLTVYYKRTLSGKISVMPKEEMIRKGWQSPDIADAGMLSFITDMGMRKQASGSGSGRGAAIRQLSNEEIAKIVSVY